MNKIFFYRRTTSNLYISIYIDIFFYRRNHKQFIYIYLYIYIFIKEKQRDEIIKRLKVKVIHTWKIPWIMFVDINLFDEIKTDWFLLNLPAKIKRHKFFVCWMESKSWQWNFILLTTTLLTHHHLLLHTHTISLPSLLGDKHMRLRIWKRIF